MNINSIVQITTRGDVETTNSLLKTNKRYPVQRVADFGLWANEAYGISGNSKANKIGIGLIRPEIFRESGKNFTIIQVCEIYEGIIHELERRGYEWELICNGSQKDYNFGKELLRKMHRTKDSSAIFCATSAKMLVEKISTYRAVVAVRLYLAVIAASFQIPMIMLEWKDKIRFFAQNINQEQYCIQDKFWKKTSYLIDELEKSMAAEYDMRTIDNLKQKTISTLKNII